MSTPIPAYVSQIILDSSSDGVTVTDGTNTGTASLSTARWYYFISNRATTNNGQSLLYALAQALRAAGLAATPTPINSVWTVALGYTAGSSLYKLYMYHNVGSTITVSFESATIATALGFSSNSIAVATSTTVAASNYSYWWWTPDMAISETGPVPFDPATQYGVPSSAGSAQRSSDMTAAYTQNGIQYEASYKFNGVSPYYKIRPVSTQPNADLETWWRNGPCLGRRILMWRDRSNTTATSAPSKGTETPYNYIEYQPNDTLRAQFPASPVAAPNLTYWDVNLGLWLTENGETPISD